MVERIGGHEGGGRWGEQELLRKEDFRRVGGSQLGKRVSRKKTQGGLDGFGWFGGLMLAL